MRRYCLMLDLKDEPDLIREYEEYHRKIWPEILESIADAGVQSMIIYRFGNRLSMTMEVDDSFSFERKAALDGENEKVQEWEQLMWKYQQALPGAEPGQKWVLAKKIFDASEYIG